MPGGDSRRVVGSKVVAKAIHVTNLAECKRRYGANAKKKEVVGVITEVITTKTRTNRDATHIAATYYIGGTTTKRKTLNIRSVRAATDVETQQVVDHENSENENEDVVVNPTDSPPPSPPPLSPPTGPTDNEEQKSESSDEENNNDEEENEDDADEDVVFPNDVPATIMHGSRWYSDDRATKQHLHGRIPVQEWRVQTPIGDWIGPGSDVQRQFSCLQYFLFLFPPQQLNLMHRLTNEKLQGIEGQQQMLKGELLKFIGVFILITRFEKISSSRASLWLTMAPSKYIPAVALGKTGMLRQRFDAIFRCICFGEQPVEQPEDMTSEQYQWRLIDDFVANFNGHRASMFMLSDRIVVDELIVCWYGLGGAWINMGLPQYVAIDWKPDNGCEIQNAACSRSGVMLQLNLVKTANKMANEAADNNALHGTQVLTNLVSPWYNTNCGVCADSYFASVSCALEMARNGLGFIGVVKTATRQYPMQWLSQFELDARGDWHGLVLKTHEAGNAQLLVLSGWIVTADIFYLTPFP